MNLKKILGILAIVLIIFWIVTRPDSAAGSVESLGGTLHDWADNVTTFFTEIVD